MGNPSQHYREMLTEFMRLSSIKMSLPKLPRDKLLSEDELESLAAPVRDSNPMLACYHAGIAVANFFSDPNLGCDQMNAAIGSVGMMMDFFGIDDEEEQPKQ